MHKIAGNLFDLKRNEINSKFEIHHQKIDFVCKVSFLEENPIKNKSRFEMSLEKIARKIE